MAVLVTGGTGFVGSNIVKALARRGQIVICLDLVPPDNLVKKYIEPWKDYVTNRNESFFINKDYEDEAQGDTNFLMLITRLKKYWPNLSDKNRDCIWKYLNTLIFLNSSTMPLINC